MIFLITANFGGVMGCAIGMLLAAACEIIYWLTLKPVAKLMVSYNMTLTAKPKDIYNITFLMLFLTFCIFAYHHFHNVYLMFIDREL